MQLNLIKNFNSGGTFYGFNSVVFKLLKMVFLYIEVLAVLNVII